MNNNIIQELQHLEEIRSIYDYVKFVDDRFAKRHAETIPESKLNKDERRERLIPHHGMYQKSYKIRMVFDSSTLELYATPRA